MSCDALPKGKASFFCWRDLDYWQSNSQFFPNFQNLPFSQNLPTPNFPTPNFHSSNFSRQPRHALPPAPLRSWKTLESWKNLEAGKLQKLREQVGKLQKLLPPAAKKQASRPKNRLKILPFYIKKQPKKYQKTQKNRLKNRKNSLFYSLSTKTYQKFFFRWGAVSDFFRFSHPIKRPFTTFQIAKKLA